VNIDHHRALRKGFPVDTRFGQIRVKVARRGAVVLHAAPEYDDCKAAARRHGVPLSVVYEEAKRAWAEGNHQA
jgi:uncharacterized protein (DUF111 family)